MFGWLSLLCPAARSPAIAEEYPYDVAEPPARYRAGPTGAGMVRVRVPRTPRLSHVQVGLPIVDNAIIRDLGQGAQRPGFAEHLQGDAAEAPACHLSHDPDALLAMVRIPSGFHLDVGTGG